MALPLQPRGLMLWVAAVVLFVAWVVTLLAGVSGGVHHLLLVAAVVTAIVWALRRRARADGPAAGHAPSFEAYLARERAARRKRPAKIRRF